MRAGKYFLTYGRNLNEITDHERNLVKEGVTVIMLTTEAWERYDLSYETPLGKNGFFDERDPQFIEAMAYLMKGDARVLTDHMIADWKKGDHT
jgi:hypothetical protein